MERSNMPPGAVLPPQISVPSVPNPQNENVGHPDLAPLKAYPLHELLTLEIPKREMIIAPWLPDRGLAMIYGKTGYGKSWLGLTVGVAVAYGQDFLGFTVPSARKVLVIDGEMQHATLIGRLSAILLGFGIEDASGDALVALADSVQDGRSLPDLSTEGGQAQIEEFVAEADLIILDNLSTLTRSGRENEAESWQTMQAWLVALRRAGKSVILVHHAGKDGQQRGTSKREDVLDTVIDLRRPQNYVASQGVRFELYFQKGRQLYGADAEPFEASCEVQNDRALWTRAPISNIRQDEARGLRDEGQSIRQIAAEMGISKSAANRLLDEQSP